MKFRYLLSSVSLVLLALVLQSNDDYLLPEIFTLHKGETVNVHLFTSAGFEHPWDRKYNLSQTVGFHIWEGNKKTDVKNLTASDTLPVLAYKLNSSGLALVDMIRDHTDTEIGKAEFISEIDDEGQTKIYDKVNTSTQTKFNIRYISCLKTLLQVDKADGNLFSKELQHPLEIVLQQNPYKGSYGDDITALVKFKGKPLVNAHVDLLVKNLAGKVYAQRLNSDQSGNIYFKLSREGVYLLRMVSIQPSTIKAIDFEKWGATYVFAFSNAGKMPNTYKEFGLGNKH